MSGGIDSSTNKFGTIVKWHDPKAARQAGLKLDQFLLDAVHDRARVLPNKQHHNPDHGLALAVTRHRALAHARREGDRAEVAHVHGHAVAASDHDIADVGEA